MSDTEIIKVEVDPSQVPMIITAQINSLKELKENVTEALQKAEQAQESAKNAKDKPTGVFKKKEAIESLQTATVDLADAQMSAASAQQVSFEYQQRLGEITKYLLGLGVSNIAMNRTVVRELELRLRGASEEELDELARKELIGVVKQLKAQEDIMKKQNHLTMIVREHDVAMREYEEREKEQDDLLKAHTAKDKEHDRRLSEKDIKDKKRDQEITRQANKDREHDRRLDEKDEKDQSQDGEIERQALKNKEHDDTIKTLLVSNENNIEKINELENRCGKLELELQKSSEEMERLRSELDEKMATKTGRLFDVSTLIISLTALIMIIIHFFV